MTRLQDVVLTLRSAVEEQQATRILENYLAERDAAMTTFPHTPERDHFEHVLEAQRMIGQAFDQERVNP